MEAHAQTAPVKRYLAMFTPGGTIQESWAPTTTGSNFTLSPILSPLAPHKSKLLILGGVGILGNTGFGDGHAWGITRFLTCSPIIDQGGWTAGGMSVDQYIANKLGAKDPFKSVELQVGGTTSNCWGRISYAGPGQPLPGVADPQKVFDRLFKNLQAPNTGPDPALVAQYARRRSILDSVKEEYTRLNAQIGASDRHRINNHLQSIREIELRLTALPEQTTVAACVAPDRPGTDGDFVAKGRLQMDLMAMAIICGLTRVATIQWTRSTSNQTFPWLGLSTSDGHHSLTHDLKNADSRAKLVKIHTWYAEQFGYLLSKLDSVKEGDRTVLDNSIVVWGNEINGSHNRNNVPFVVAGSGGGYFRTGRFLKFTNGSHADLHVSCLNALGIPDTTFGEAGLCNGPMSDLT